MKAFNQALRTYNFYGDIMQKYVFIPSWVYQKDIIEIYLFKN